MQFLAVNTQWKTHLRKWQCLATQSSILKWYGIIFGALKECHSILSW